MKSNQAGGGALTESPNDLYEFYPETQIKKQCEFINSLAEKNSSAEFYVYNIEMDRTIEPFDKKNTHYIYNLEKKYYSNKVTYGSFLLNSYEDYLKYNFRSDHHWNEEGKKKGYLELCKLLGIKSPPIKVKGSYDTNMYFIGTRLTHITDKALGEELIPVYADKFSAYLFNFPVFKIFSKHVYDYNGPPLIISSRRFQKKIEGKLYMTEDYHDWQLIESGTRILNESAKQNENLLIFGYSHARPEVYLLASHFKNTYFFQPRDKGSINLSEFIDEKNINKVLFIDPNHYKRSYEKQYIK